MSYHHRFGTSLISAWWLLHHHSIAIAIFRMSPLQITPGQVADQVACKSTFQANDQPTIIHMLNEHPDASFSGLALVSLFPFNSFITDHTKIGLP